MSRMVVIISLLGRVRFTHTSDLANKVATGNLHLINVHAISSRGTKVEKLLTLAPERYTAGFHMVAKVILWCI